MIHWIQARAIDHASGSHGIPGIFIRYEISPLKIAVKEVHRSYFMLLVELAGIFGGVYATSGKKIENIQINFQDEYLL